MSALRRGWARLLSLFRRDGLDHEFEEEAQSHLELAVDDYLRRGVPEAEARRLARLRFGSVAASKDAHRDSRGLPSLEAFAFDLRMAVRGLGRDRAFTAAAVTMLALAIGLNVTVFAVMDAMLFRGYPHVQRSDRLLFLQERSLSGGCCIAPADFEDWRAEARSFEGMAMAGGGPLTFRDGAGRASDMRAPRVSVNLFGLLGVQPILGRDFAPGDDAPGAPPVLLLNHRFWQHRFGGRADVGGTIVYVDRLPATIIGVMPEGFDFPLPIDGDLWLPAASTASGQRGLAPGSFTVVARLRDGVSREHAQAELDAINQRLALAYPETNRDLVVHVSTHAEMNSGPDAPMIWGSLWVGAWFVFLIACANLANLTLVRTIGRWREFATRLALGAGQARMIRQIALESLVLASAAGAIGWAITIWSVAWWARVTASLYQVLDYTVDARTFVYLFGIAAIAAVLLAAAPIVRIRQLGVSGALKGDARGVTHGLRGKRLAGALVAGQMALAIVLLSGAGVLVRSFVAVVNAETGVRDPEFVLLGRLRMPSELYPSAPSRADYLERASTRLAAVPGVTAQALSNARPVRFVPARPTEIEGRPVPDRTGEAVPFVTAGADYFRVVGASAISGRAFNLADGATSQPVAIVNASFAAAFWPGEEAVGKRLRVVDRATPEPWRVIVGVVPNIMNSDPLRQRFRPLVYVPFSQEPEVPRAPYFLLRTSLPAVQVASAVQAELQRVDPDVTLEEFQTLRDSFAFDRDFMDAEHSELGKYSKVAPVFALMALLLAAIGLTAVMAHAVSQRTKEIGVRVAIGATRRDIRRLIFGEGMRPVILGAAIGLGASLAVNRLLESQLVGVSPDDPLTLAAAAAVLMLVALMACQVPFRRALRVDPVIALRHE